MRGTGSNTGIAEDVFVPAHRTVPLNGLFAGNAQSRADDPQLRLPFIPVATLDLLGPILGIGRAALALAVDEAFTKSMRQFIECQHGSIRAQLQVSELKLQTATLHAYGVAEELDRSAAEGRQLSYADRARFKAMCWYAAQHVIDASTC